MAKDVIITPLDGDIQFKNSSGTEAGKIEQLGDDLVLTNAVGDILIGDGTADVYIGDGIANVDIIFEQNGSIRGETAGGVTLTIGSNDTNLNITGSGTMHLVGAISSSALNLSTLPPLGSENTTLVIDSTGVVGVRENAASSGTSGSSGSSGTSGTSGSSGTSGTSGNSGIFGFIRFRYSGTSGSSVLLVLLVTHLVSGTSGPVIR
jgi:hypothetical protein